MFQHMLFGMVDTNYAHHSQTMSAFIKSIRLRRADDAVYWMSRHIAFNPKDQFRLTRRILISAGEDCICTPVQSAVADWVFQAMSEKDLVKWYRGAVSMVHLICATDDWWALPSGRNYIRGFWEAEKAIGLGIGQPGPSDKLVQHILKNKQCSDYKSKTEYAQSIANIARCSHNIHARIPASIHVRFGKFLANDDNYLAQAVYRLAFGKLGKSEYPHVSGKTVAESVTKAAARLKKDEPVPKHFLDGIHCFGKDKRFAGILSSMMACGIAYLYFGRLDPTDTWKEGWIGPEADIILNLFEGAVGSKE